MTLRQLEVPTDSGRWLHLKGPDFLFAYVDNNWSAPLQAAVKLAFDIAVGEVRRIQERVRHASGYVVENGLYLMSWQDMTNALEGLPGVVAPWPNENRRSYSGRTGAQMILDIFKQFLDGLGGPIDPIERYLVQAMIDVQRQMKISAITDYFGIVLGLVSAVPETEQAATLFQYLCASADVSRQLLQISCSSPQPYSLDVSYVTVTLQQR